MHARATMVGALAIVLSIVLGGCTASPRQQLERVAKDWCETIRASQVMPVYPLTEDLQPGDVFLVETPIQTQARIYRQRGFLPLDLMVTRLNTGVDFAALYGDAYWAGTYSNVPHARPLPGSALPDPIDDEGETDETDDAEEGEDSDESGEAEPSKASPAARFVKAPRAAFPSYTFEVRRGMGAKIAIPVQGVPVGLGIMKSRAASGSVTISDAYTYALNPETLLSAVYTWAEGANTKTMLKALAKENPGRTLYLRVVQRVYLTGGVVVSLQNNEAGSFGADVGDAKEISVVDVALGDTTEENFNAASDALSGAMNAGATDTAGNLLPGGSLRIVEASRRSVIMKENFDRPLVIGYLGYDLPIKDDGSVGIPIATIEQLRDPARARTSDAPAYRPATYRAPTGEIEPLRKAIDTWTAADPATKADRERQIEQHVRKVHGSDQLYSVWIRSASAEELRDVAQALRIPVP
jgi:hypothetical protein